MNEPYSKERQLGRGERRYRRKVASPKQWQAIIAAKKGTCRVCGFEKGTSMHHVVPRDAPYFGDDVPDNIVPVCLDCHLLIHLRSPLPCRTLCMALTDAENAYAVQKVGEAVFERVYGIEYQR